MYIYKTYTDEREQYIYKPVIHMYINCVIYAYINLCKPNICTYKTLHI